MVGIGFFAPLPLALMMPFMAGQSMLMGDAFGKAYQYGKRKISAMSNEEFNKLDAKQLGIEIQTDYADMIPSLTQAIKSSTAFQSLIIRELAEILKNLPKDIFAGFTGSPEGTTFSLANATDNLAGGLGIGDALNQIAKSLSGMGLQEAYADSGPPPPTPPPKETDFSVDEPHWPSLTLGEAIQLRNYMKKHQLDISQKGIWDNLTTWINLKTQGGSGSSLPPPPGEIIQTNLGATSKKLQDKLLKYLSNWNTAVKNIHTVKLIIIQRQKSKLSTTKQRAGLNKSIRLKKLSADIFNVALKQSRNHSDLTPAWGKVKPLSPI